MSSSLARRLPCIVRRVTLLLPIDSRSGRLLNVAAALLFSAGALTANAQGSCSVNGSTVTCTNSATFDTPDVNPQTGFLPTGAPIKANTFPTSMTVTGASGTITNVIVELDGIDSKGANGNDYNGLDGAEFVLVAPNGNKLLFLGSPGDSSDSLAGTTLIMSDKNPTTGNPNPLPPSDFNPSCTSPPSDPACDLPTTGTQNYAPFSDSTAASGWAWGPTFPTLSDFVASNLPQYDGNATFASVFNGVSVNGNWDLYLVDWNGDPVTVHGWKLTLTFNSTAVPTATVLATNTNPAIAGNTVTYTATVTSTGGTVNGGTVSFFANNSTTPIVCAGGNQTVSSGTATCQVALAAGSVAQCTSFDGSGSQTLPTFPTVCQGVAPITATYSGSGSFTTSSSNTLHQVVGGTPTQSTDTWCNPAPFGIPLDGTGIDYPSYIAVSGYGSQTVSTATVTLNGLFGASDVDGQFLLVAPNGQNLDVMDFAFSGVPPAGPINITIADGSPQEGGNSPGTSGTYGPYDGVSPSTSESWPVSIASQTVAAIPAVPATINYPTPHGSAINTLEHSLSGAPADGDWSLYVTGQNGTGQMYLNGGWCINLTVNSGTPTTTTLVSSKNPQTASQSVTLTATVVDQGNNPVTSGTVTFTDNGQAPAGVSSNTVTLNGSGQASITTSSLAEGDHLIAATFNATGSDNSSFANLTQRVDNATQIYAANAAIPNGGTCSATYCYCNPGAISSNTNNKGAFTPDPSNIFVTNLPGTINKVTLGLNQYSSATDILYSLESMVVGPTGADLDFFSNAGWNGGVGGTASLGNYIFSDAAGAQVGQAVTTLSPGTYQPSSYPEGDTNWPEPAQPYTASSSGFYTLPGAITYAASRGSGTLNGQFSSTDPNGTWSLYMTEDAPAGVASAAHGWCVNFTENAVTVTVDDNHSGTGTSGDFIAGETGAQITTVVNVGSGNGPTGDPLGTNPLKLVDTLNAAFTYTGFTGTGWSCSAVGQIVTCTNDSAITAGAAYPTLTLNVTVSGTATGSISNSSSVSGGGATSTTSNTDSITVEGAASLAISKSHTGTFTQGSTATWTLVVSNTAATGSTSGTVTVSDTLPTGYTLSSSTSTSSLFNCTGTSTVTCTGTPGIAAGGSNTITLTVNVPANSPTSVSNTASVWGGGDTVHNSAGTAATSNTDTATVIATTTTTAASQTVNFSPSAQSVTLGATVTSNAGTVNAGTVTFTVMNGGTQIGTAVGPVSVTSGSASATYTLPSGTSVGTYTIVASYTAAGNFTSSSDNTHTLTVAAASTTTTASNQSAPYSASIQNVTLSATVTSGAGTVNAGTVTFTVLNGATPVGVATTSATVTSGSASVSYALPAGTTGGTYTIQAVYNGSTDFTGSTDNTHTLTITGGTTTTTASFATATYSSNSQPVLLNANVTSGGGTVNSGTVTFTVMQGATPIGSPAGPVSVSNGGAPATYTLPGGTNAGTYTIVATYTGAGGFTSSSDNLHTLTISAAATATTASSQTATFSSAPQTVTLSANVTSTAGTVNGGTVTFLVLNGGTPIGTPTNSAPIASGSASVNYALPPGTPAGAYTILAAYNGSTDFQTSNDSTKILTITGASTTAIANNTTATFNAGNAQPVTLSAAVNSPAGLVSEGAVTFTVMNGSTQVGTPVIAPVAASTASTTFSLPAGTGVGSYTIQAVYADPGGNFTASNDSTHTLTVNPVQTFVVLNNNDSGSGSLRAALASAATAGGGNILFDAGAFGSGATITLQSGLTIPDNTTITGLTGGSGNLVTVSGNNAYRIFQVNSGSAGIVIANLNLENGSGIGGAINNGGALTVTGSTFSSNAGPTGAGIWNSGTVTVSDSSFSQNSVTNGGGAISNSNGTLTVTNSTFANNTAATGGGAIWNNGTESVTNGTFYGNAATSAGGGALTNVGGTLALNNSILSHNVASTTGAAVWNSGTVTESYNDFDNNSVFGFTASGTDLTGAANLAALGDYGGPTQTMIPLPGSAAICAGLAADIPNGVTIDQRGLPNTNSSYPGYSAGSPCVDAGAVQTNYAISFTAPVSDVAPNTAMSPAPAVTLDESGTPFAGAAVTIPLTLTSNPSGATLSGGSASTTAGVATYSTLSVNQPGTGDQLTATLALNTAPAVSLSAQSGTFTVSKITPTLSFTPNPASQIYGTGIPVGSLDATATFNSTAVPGTFVYTTTVGGNPVTLAAGATVLPAGTYTITALFTPSNSAVYTGATTTASYTVNAAGLTITASTSTMNYGGTVPTITPIYSGFANGDTAASLTTPPTCSTTATSHSSVGTYPTSCSGAVDANYTISYMTGTVTVSAVPLTITASSATMTYGGAVPTITPSYAGFVNGDTAASLTTPPTCSTTATNHSAVGNYASSCSGAVDANYTISYTPGSVTVGQSALTITASSATMSYGGTVPTIAPSYAGFVNGDTAATLTTPPICSTTATSLSPVGSYPTSCAGAVDANYSIGYVAGLVTVGQAASVTTVKLSSASITPGQSETITVTVASATTGTPTGSVGIYDGTALLTTVTLSSGKGTYSTTALAPGMTHVITAVYAGDANFAGSTSTANTSVTVAPLDFTMTISGPASATVIPGQSISYQVSVTPLYGSYAGQVNFAITGLPAGATVTFSPSSIAANGGPQTITVTITAPPATASYHAPQAPSPTRRAAPLALAFLLLFGLGAMRRQGRAVRRRLLTVVLLLAGGAAATLVSGCGGGFFAQAPQNYNVTINATAANLQHSVTVTLNVQ